MDTLSPEALLRLQVSGLEAAVNAVVITDVEAVILWANPAFFALSGYSPVGDTVAHPAHAVPWHFRMPGGELGEAVPALVASAWALARDGTDNGGIM